MSAADSQPPSGYPFTVLHLRPGGRPGAFGWTEALGELVVEVVSDQELLLRVGDNPMRWLVETDVATARARLGRQYVNLLVVDLRCAQQESCRPEHRVEAGFAFLRALDEIEDIEARYGFHRILVLVGGVGDARTDELLVALGALGVGRVMRERADEPFARQVASVANAMVSERFVGSRALCAAGGGITGIYFEIGALKCLDDCLPEGINDFDMYFGISAGAVVMSLLAAGYSIDELMAAIVGAKGGRIEPLTMSLLRLGNFNYPDIARRLGSVAKVGGRALLRVGRQGTRGTADALFLDYTALLGQPLRSDSFEVLLRRILSHPGATNDFRKLRRRLYIGASDQDTRQHVMFGDSGFEHVPISQAIQASISVNPAFSAVRIDGRYYEDGAVTRTSHFVEAIGRGADLMFVFDPFVPYVSKHPGMSNQRGMLYNIDQDIRAISFTRFEHTREWALRKYPHVSSYTFLPSNRLRRLLSANPMDHRPYLSIWRGAYLSTWRRLRALSYRLRGDLLVHGLTLDMGRADAVARRLLDTVSPSFEDFFPERQVRIKQPRLCCGP